MTTTIQFAPIPLCDLRIQHEPIGLELESAIREVLSSHAYILGPQVAHLERQVAAYCGTVDAVACSSGSDALLLALMALDIGPGDEVITSPYTFFATAGSIVRLGARPVFVDISPATYNIRAEAIESRITERTKAIMPVHLFGQMADMDAILAIARQHNLAVVEDAAQAIGAEDDGRRAGSLGTLGCFSFFPSKNLGCCGDGGMVTTNDRDLGEKMRALRAHGAKKKYHHTLVGGNFRLDTMQAAILLVKLRYLDSWNQERRTAASRYRELLSDVDRDTLLLPAEATGCRHVFNQYVVRTPRRDAVVDSLQRAEIGSAVYYPVPLHLQPCFANLGYHVDDFPESERASRETCALPMFPGLELRQQQRVSETIRTGLRVECG